jgi:thioredoxin 2
MTTMASEMLLVRCQSCGTLNRVPAGKLANRPVCGQCRTPLTVPTRPVNATASTFDQEIANWPEYVLVEFWAKWCGYCRMVEPVINDLASWRAGKLKIVKVDVDDEPILARRFQTRATPTFILYRNGGQIARMDGAPKEKIELVQWIDSFLRV